MFKTVLRVLSLLLSLAAISAQPGKPEKPRDIGSRLELFVDDYLIESMNDLELKLHSPRPAGKVLILDRPWEGVTSIPPLRENSGTRRWPSVPTRVQSGSSALFLRMVSTGGRSARKPSSSRKRRTRGPITPSGIRSKNGT